jgi:hypothetical protein
MGDRHIARPLSSQHNTAQKNADIFYAPNGFRTPDSNVRDMDGLAHIILIVFITEFFPIHFRLKTVSHND